MKLRDAVVGFGILAIAGCGSLEDVELSSSETGSDELRNYSDANCERQVDRIAQEFERALGAPNAEIAYFSTSSKFNPCKCGDTLELSSVTTVTGHSWANSVPWGFKAAELFEFEGGDRVYVDTQTGHHNVLCADGRVQWTNWVQWITGDSVDHDQCSTLGCGETYPNWDEWCGPLLVCAFDSYCTFPESGATCPEDEG